ncbi:hypothetical protein [Tunicatimonas pelagia]|uniref:hypothetical protein n=1 Tax=Tunicatimonas pelagia TaxID=931531 RepID=UPI002665FCA2|nr:hypothetical protein [Tunicatimonas pelagia]WKN45380.1 hypothetical protein P0M28_10470 [Tunicatimonas pelagia]
MKIKDTITWRDIEVTIKYNDCYHKYNDLHIARLKIEAAIPLPITETGYKSHFTHPDNIEASGGAVSFVTAWLDHHAQKPEWIDAEEQRRQYSLL